MGFTPRYIGDTRALHNTFNTDSGVYKLNGLSASDLAIYFVNINTNIQTQGVGTWAITSAPAGQADYTPDAGDVIITTAGMYSWWTKVGGVPFDPQLVQVLDPSKVE